MQANTLIQDDASDSSIAEKGWQHMACRFWMVGIPGHYNPAARRVSFMALRGFKAMQLAGRADTPEGEPSTSAAAAAGGSSRKRAVGATTAAGKGKGKAELIALLLGS